MLKALADETRWGIVQHLLLADRAKAMTMAQWEHLGLKRAGGQPFPNPADKAYLLAPAGAELGVVDSRAA